MGEKDPSEKSLGWREGGRKGGKEGGRYWATVLTFSARVSDKNRIKCLTSIKKSTRSVLLPAALFNFPSFFACGDVSYIHLIPPPPPPTSLALSHSVSPSSPSFFFTSFSVPSTQIRKLMRDSFFTDCPRNVYH